MNESIQNKLQARLYNWFMRKTTPSAVRRVGELPVMIGSDIGNVRGENQDRVAVLKVSLDRNQSFVVVALCDGMGGMVEGSACASQAIASFFAFCVRRRDVPLQTRLVMAAHEANRAVHALYQGRGGATLSALLLDGLGNTFGINIGDSRIYSYRENKLEQLTVDDTMAGLLNRGENDVHSSNELIQFIGMGDGVEPHAILMPSANELMMLTSDGAHFIDKGVMQMVVQNAKEPAMAVKRIIEVAKWCGGRDNATVAIASPLVFQPQLFDDTGLIQVWDPFGELQVFAVDKYDDQRAENMHPWEKKSAVQKAADGIAHLPKLIKKKRPTKKKATDKVVPKIDDTDTALERPQLKIYFNANTDKGGNHA